MELRKDFTHNINNKLRSEDGRSITSYSCSMYYKTVKTNKEKRSSSSMVNSCENLKHILCITCQ